IAQRVIKLLIDADVTVKGARVGVLGLTFKEDCNDLRNSKVPDILRELQKYGITPLTHDPIASPKDAIREYGVKLCAVDEMVQLDALVLAVSHTWYLSTLGQKALFSMLRDGGILVDVKSALTPGKPERGVRYWSV
ncbi:MAG: UDP binding domain-containing protein, partial [Polyangiaceae bacterium]